MFFKYIYSDALRIHNWRHGESMKANAELADFLNEWRRNNSKGGKSMTYSAMERRVDGTTTWSTWGRLCQHVPMEVKAATFESIIKLTGIDRQELYELLDPELRKQRDSSYKKTREEREMDLAGDLWRWLNFNKQRCTALRLMGYEGVLPDNADDLIGDSELE